MLLSFGFFFFYNSLLRKHLAATFTEHMFWARVYKTWKEYLIFELYQEEVLSQLFQGVILLTVTACAFRLE